MVDSRCQPFLARRGPVVHLADLRKWLREYARRGPVVHRATIIWLQSEVLLAARRGLTGMGSFYC